MTQLQKYTWLIDTIRRAGKISHRALSDKWERCKELSDEKPLHRAAFNRWRDAIWAQFGIMIECQRVGGYLYYIANPEDIDEDRLKKWMLDAFAVGNLIGENLMLKDRILVDKVPSGRAYLTTILEAMKENRVVRLEYKTFESRQAFTFPVEPYCVKLFENRWYLLGHNLNRDTLRIYSLDRIVNIEVTDNTFTLPKDFDGTEYFADSFGIVVDNKVLPTRIKVRANADHAPYIKSLPLHHSQRIVAETPAYCDFELFLAPTYDFIMRILHSGAMLEVLEPASLRSQVASWIEAMAKLYDGSERR